MGRHTRSGRLGTGALALLLAAGALAAVPTPTALPNLPPSFDAATLVAAPTGVAPTVDGVVDSVWSGARPLEVTAVGGSGAFPPGSGIQVRALYDSGSLFLLIEWADATPDFAKSAWVLLDNSTPGGNWSQQAWGDDALSLVLDDRQGLEQNFSGFGCGALCHTGAVQEMRTDSPGTVDVWHWSSALTLPFGYADDLYMDNQSKSAGSLWGGFHGDGPDPAAPNLVTTVLGDRPAYLNGTVPLTQSARYVAEADKAAINWTTFNSSALPNGTRVPGYVLSAPSQARGEVRAGAVHTGSGWRLELSRPLTTSDNASRDIAFDDLNATYYWSLSLNDNRTGDNASRAGILYTMIFADNALPDLTAESVFKALPFTVIGDPVNLTVRVYNRGFGPTLAAVFAALLDANATEVANISVPTVASADLYLANFTFPSGTYSVGAHNFTAVLDTAGSELESFEDNNSIAFQVTFVTIAAPPDLAIATANGPVGTVFAGQLFTIDGTVRNNGPGDSVAPVILRALHPSFPTLYIDVGPLSANGTASFSFTFNSSGKARASYPFTVMADPNDTIAEADESVASNLRPVPVDIDDRPDLVARGVTADPPSGLEGGALNLTLTVSNRGAGFYATVDVWFYLDNATATGSANRTAAWSVTLDLAFNESVNVSANWSMPVGLGYTTHYLRVFVDASDVVHESNEGNNNASVQVLVLEPLRPDLVVNGLVLGAPEYRVGEQATANIVVTNQGVAYTGAVRMEVVEATVNRSLGNVTVPAVGAGLSLSFSFNFTVSPGTPGRHSVLVIVDVDNITNEGKFELNNAATVNFTLLAAATPDLAVGQMDFQPPLPALGSVVTIVAIIANHGGAASLPTAVAFTWGATAIGSADVPALGPLETFTASFAWDTSGVRSLSVLVQVTLNVPAGQADGNLSNNLGSIQIALRPAGQPSFRLGAAKVAPATATEGAAVRIEVMVSNNGTAAGTAVLRFLVDGVEINRTNLTLPAGGSATVSTTWTAAGAGSHRAGVELQLDGLSVNASSQAFTVAGPAAGGEPPFVALSLLALVVVVLLSLALLRRPPARGAQTEGPEGSPRREAGHRAQGEQEAGQGKGGGSKPEGENPPQEQ